ncbi:MAG TPA: hypothetical protein VNJ71_07990 [Gemmatimonadales bacterium]|jgi:hypothetical protein|nr:hypothetical protein [Gemmatimonadales bacterium]
MAAAVRLLRLSVRSADRAPLDRMLAAWPGARRLPAGLEVPLVDVGPEEVLAHCVAARVVVLGSAVIRPSRGGAP